MTNVTRTEKKLMDAIARCEQIIAVYKSKAPQDPRSEVEKERVKMIESYEKTIGELNIKLAKERGLI